jgi:hypothetical protein
MGMIEQSVCRTNPALSLCFCPIRRVTLVERYAFASMITLLAQCAKETTSKVRHFQLRPDPLAK